MFSQPILSRNSPDFSPKRRSVSHLNVHISLAAFFFPSLKNVPIVSSPLRLEFRSQTSAFEFFFFFPLIFKIYRRLQSQQFLSHKENAPIEKFDDYVITFIIFPRSFFHPFLPFQPPPPSFFHFRQLIIRALIIYFLSIVSHAPLPLLYR